MRLIEIEWRHSDQEGSTCVRCSETGAELQKAVDTLAAECRPCGRDTRFKETKLTAERIAESNIILINGKKYQDPDDCIPAF